MPHVRIGKADVAYGVAGDGPGLVLIHGTGGSGATTWGHVLEQFTEWWTVVTPDLPGSGETTDDGGRLQLADLSGGVAAAAADASLDRYSLVGFSLGAAVAAHLAATEPDRVDALVMVAGTTSGLDGRSKLQFDLWRRLSESDPSLFSRMWLLTGFSPSFVAGIPPNEVTRAASFPLEAGLARQCELNTRIDLGEVLSSIRARTLVLGCTYDWIVPPSESRALAEGISRSKYSQLDAGHMAMFEAPAEFVQSVSTFLRH
jgi:3-oxoadipate enol-lactonase